MKIPMECKACGHKFDYEGFQIRNAGTIQGGRFTTSCPACRGSVTLESFSAVKKAGNPKTFFSFRRTS